MKIAIITPHIFNPSGIGSMCNNLTSELIKGGCEVSIFTFDMLPQYKLNKINKNAKICIIKQTNWVQDKRYRLLALLNIFKSMILKLHRADIIHIHGYTDLTIAGFIVGKIFRKPIILHFHGTDVWYYKKSFFNLYKRIVRNVDKVICVSQCLADKLLKDTGVSAEVIPNMVSACFIEQKSKRSSFLNRKFNADKILLNVKGLIPIYGHEILIRSLPEVIKEYPNSKLVLTGEGPLLKGLEQLTKKLNLEKNVIFTGFKSHKALVNFYVSADIYVLSSTLEAMPNVVLESLSCGTPVITTNNPAGIELTSQYPDDVTLLDEDTPFALASAIIKLLDEDRRVKEDTIKSIAEQLNKEIITQKFMNIYSEISKQYRKRIC